MTKYIKKYENLLNFGYTAKEEKINKDVECSIGFFMLIARKFGFEVYGIEAYEKTLK
ncbi:MAG: hypothetical protein ABDH19_05900 [Thermodesulfovibrio sp.]